MSGARIYESLERGHPAADISGRAAPLSVSAASSWHVRLFFLFFLLTLPLVNPWVRGDGVGYYAYLRSTLIDHDLNFENDYFAGNKSFVMSRFDAQGHLLPELYTKTGHVENHFTVGPAILWAPVLVTVHVAVLLLDGFGAHIAADGYSRPYLVAMGLTTAFYGFLSFFWRSEWRANISSRNGRSWPRLESGWRVPYRCICISILPGRTHFRRFRFPCSFGIGIAPGCSGPWRSGRFWGCSLA